MSSHPHNLSHHYLKHCLKGCHLNDLVYIQGFFDDIRYFEKSSFKEMVDQKQPQACILAAKVIQKKMKGNEATGTYFNAILKFEKVTLET
jgi:hypothetical protein